MLNPYFGSSKLHRSNNESSVYGRDCRDSNDAYLEKTSIEDILPEHRVDGDWLYHFNSLGFRGEELDPKSDFRLFVAGCSHTFGTGVRWEQTWGYLLCRELARVLKKKRPNCLNFGEGGVSNDCISRVVLSQCAGVRPDFLVVLFSYMARKEIVKENKVLKLGSWTVDARDLPVDRAFLEMYEHDNAVTETIKNMLLVQYFCKSHSIPYLIGCCDREKLSNERTITHPVSGPLAKQIDRDHFFDFSLRKRGKHVDVARDLSHPGAKSHEIFASRLVEPARRVLQLF